MDINSLIYSECHNPVKVKIYNGIKNCYENKNVPCGQCYHCKITRINEWVTRMVVQSNYSNYVYYGTLTYDGKHTTAIEECLPVWSCDNYTKKRSYTPLILRKDHLQKFFKRLRKNTGIKFQYACCGEYGSTYGRPHFHYIIWSDVPIRLGEIKKAWCSPLVTDPNKRALIGRIEHRDIKHNAYLNDKDKDVTHVYKYVCKYIQKSDFDFDKLPNKNNHYYNFKKRFDYVKVLKHDENSPMAFDRVYTCNDLDDYLKDKDVCDYDTYKKVFSPFFHCSKKPAIGFHYLQDNLREFQKGNFKLFGLSGKYIFPLYFVRKTKESLCPLKAKSETNEGATSYSRLPKMESLLQDIISAQQIAEDTDQTLRPFWYHYNNFYLESNKRIQDLKRVDVVDDTKENVNYTIDYLNAVNELDLDSINIADYICQSDNNIYYVPRAYLSFYNIEKHVYYSFCGSYYKLYNTRTKEFIKEESLEDVKLLINYYYERIKSNLLRYLHAQSEISADKKAALIKQLVIDGDIADEYSFNKYKSKCLDNFMAKVNEHQRIYKQSKTFE